jgi:hypothetical protein
MERPGISQTDKIFSLTSISFDAMVMETYFPLFLSMYRNSRWRYKTLSFIESKSDKIYMMLLLPIWQIVLESEWENHLILKR